MGKTKSNTGLGKALIKQRFKTNPNFVVNGFYISKLRRRNGQKLS